MKFANWTCISSIVLFTALTLVPTLPAQTQTLTVLHNFTGVPDGDWPTGGLLLDAAGNLYGVTTYGGTIGSGSVFKLDPNANESVLYSFAGSPDGSQPTGGLVQDAAGNLYGVTRYGGANSPECPPGPGCGTVFKLTPGGTATLLLSFRNGYPPYGSLPVGRLVLDKSGNLFGTTQYQSFINGNCPLSIVNHKQVGYGCGTVFKLDPSGTASAVHVFDGTDGAFPYAGLVQDSAGNLFGTTSTGGVANCSSARFGECGTAFKVDTSGQFSVLYSFQGASNGPDGGTPESSLFLDADGNLYGTTNVGGTGAPCYTGITCGTIFQLTSAGKESVLSSFATGASGGTAGPTAGLVQDAAGNFYGLENGNVFKLDSTGKESTLFTFTTYPDNQASNDLVQDADGNLYGVIPGGTSGKGEVFKLTTPPDFAVPAFTLTPATVAPGSPASSTLDLIAVSGFTDTVTLACSVSPKPAQAPQCSVPASATPGTSVAVTVTTIGPSARVNSSSGGSLAYALWLPLLGLVGIGNCLGSKQRKIKAVLLSCVLFAGVMFQVACGGGSGSGGGNPGTPAGAYTITVTGTSSAATGSLVRSTNTTLTVQ